MISKLKGRTYEEIHGPEKAAYLRSIRGRKGSASNFWLGGRQQKISYRGEDWSITRAFALERDHNTCQDCGQTVGRIDVHHKVPWIVSRDNSLSNLISLCLSCHKRWDNEYIRQYGRYLVTNPTIPSRSEIMKRIWANNLARRENLSSRMKGNKHSPKNFSRNPNGTFAPA